MGAYTQKGQRERRDGRVGGGVNLEEDRHGRNLLAVRLVAMRQVPPVRQVQGHYAGKGGGEMGDGM